MTNTQDLIPQKLALLQEAEIAFHSIETGLGQLTKNIPYAPKPYYFSWFLLLSTGFERLMKIVVCLHEFESTGAFPSRRFLQNTMRHDLVVLRDEVIRRCYTTAYLGKTFVPDDLDFLTNNDVLTLILNSLNDFANQDRYMFMNRIQ